MRRPGKKLEGLKERANKGPGETEALKRKLEELKKKLEDCEKKKKEEEERREREKREEEERAKREKREKAQQEEAEKKAEEHTRYLLQNIKALGLISAPGFWEAPGLWDWLPGVLKTPVGKFAEKLAKAPIPTSTLPALAGIYQIAGALLDPCTPDGKRKTVERLMRGDTGGKYSLEEALNKTEEMCELLTKLKTLAAMAKEQNN